MVVCGGVGGESNVVICGGVCCRGYGQPVSHVTSHMSYVTFHMSHVTRLIYIYLFYKVMKLVLDGLLSTGPTPFSLMSFRQFYQLLDIF